MRVLRDKGESGVSQKSPENSPKTGENLGKAKKECQVIDTVLCCDGDYRDWSGAANQETGALDVIAIDCKNEGPGGDRSLPPFLIACG